MAGNTNLAVLEVKHLPDPVDAVDLAVVEVEGRVARRDEGIRAGVAADHKVATAVDTKRVRNISRVALHGGAEDFNVGRVDDEISRVAEAGKPLAGIGVQVALQAARVVGGGICLGDGTQVHRHVLEGARGDASAAGTLGQDDGIDVAGNVQRHGRAGDEGAIAAKRRV